MKHHTATAAACRPAAWLPRLLVTLLPLGLTALSAYAQELPQGDAAQAKPIATQSCAACHGKDGNSTSPDYPSLAGQGIHYLYEQLTDFRNGTRENAVMNAMVTTLSPADMLNLATYYSMQQPKPSAPASNLPEQTGAQIYHEGITTKAVPACATCHGSDGAGNFPEFPRLAGQQSQYVAQQLKAFRSAQRANNPNAMMRTLSARLSDKEISAVARYIAGMGQ